MGVVDFAEYLNRAIQAGTQVEGNVVRVVSDAGTEIGNAVFKVIQGGNGTASKVGIATQTGAGGSAIATGLAFLATDVGVVGAAIAPALGIVAGTGLYSLAPEFWTRVSNALVEAGMTVGGKVVSYWNGHNFFVDGRVIEIFKNQLLAENVFVTGTVFDTLTENTQIYYNGGSHTINAEAANAMHKSFMTFVAPYHASSSDPYVPMAADIFEIRYNNEWRQMSPKGVMCGYKSVYQSRNRMTVRYAFDCTELVSGATATTISIGSFNIRNSLIQVPLVQGSMTLYRTIYNGVMKYLGEYTFNVYQDTASAVYEYYSNLVDDSAISSASYRDYEFLFHFIMNEVGGDHLQPNAIYPTTNIFNITYPNWEPFPYYPQLPDPDELPDVYPLKYPEVDPDPYPSQDPAQDPDEETVTEIYPVIDPWFEFPDPGIPIDPDPEPEPDPDPIPPDPDPIPDPDPDDPIDPDPVDPNPDPDPTPVIPDPPSPPSVSSNKLFTVYNPSESGLNSLGGYLWDSSIIAAVRDIWQNPLDGVIALIQVFVTPPTSGSHNIILGFLDSGVSAPVVSSQFVTLDCGSVQIKEDKKNATDYSPYTSLHVFLPFIGIIELDVNECMKSTMHIQYKVDVYTGTCLAQIKITRNPDMSNGSILYTYSGNCSQQLPLTSGNATGVLNALIGGVTAGISVASGGGFSALAGAQLLGNSLTSEMFHVSHSGNISSNAGIMGHKKPYVIIGRKHCYDANDYNIFYGFPSNKTVRLGNLSGYARIKECRLQTTATDDEKVELMELLKNGVIF